MLSRGPAQAWRSDLMMPWSILCIWIYQLADDCQRHNIKHYHHHHQHPHSAHLLHQANCAHTWLSKHCCITLRSIDIVLIFLKLLKGVALTLGERKCCRGPCLSAKERHHGLESYLPHGCSLILPSEVNTGPGEATRLSETPLEHRGISSWTPTGLPLPTDALTLGSNSNRETICFLLYCRFKLLIFFTLAVMCKNKTALATILQ